jgi:hypothetical protein
MGTVTPGKWSHPRNGVCILHPLGAQDNRYKARRGDMDQRTGIAATLAIVAAIGSYIASCTGNWGLGLFAAIVAVPLGVVGLLMSASPRVTGGIMSIAAIVLAVIGVVLALLVMLGAIVT